MVRFILASDLTKVGAGGGTPTENIQVHEVALGEARAWLRERERQGTPLAAKIFAGLYFAHEAWALVSFFAQRALRALMPEERKRGFGPDRNPSSILLRLRGLRALCAK